MTDGRAAREQDVRGWNCGDKLLLNESFCYSQAQAVSVTGDVFAHLHRTHEQTPPGIHEETIGSRTSGGPMAGRRAATKASR